MGYLQEILLYKKGKMTKVCCISQDSTVETESVGTDIRGFISGIDSQDCGGWQGMRKIHRADHQEGQP